MLSRVKLLKINKRLLCQTRVFSDKKDDSSAQSNLVVGPPENPLARTSRLLGNDFKKIGKYFGIGKKIQKQTDDIAVEIEDSKYLSGKIEKQFQTHCDVLVIGGGGMGSSTAYWLKKRARNGLHVVVAEKDSSVSINIQG